MFTPHASRWFSNLDFRERKRLLTHLHFVRNDHEYRHVKDLISDLLTALENEHEEVKKVHGYTEDS